MFDDEVSVEEHAKEGKKAEENRFQEKLRLPSLLNAIKFNKSPPLWSSPLPLLSGTNKRILTSFDLFLTYVPSVANLSGK